MKPASKTASRKGVRSDRRRGTRYDTTLPVNIRLSFDGTPLSGAATEVSPNGMRILTHLPLIESSYVRIAFDEASNQTYCEGRVVWTQRAQDKERFESGVDIQRWGGDSPSATFDSFDKKIHPKADRRQKPR